MISLYLCCFPFCYMKVFVTTTQIQIKFSDSERNGSNLILLQIQQGGKDGLFYHCPFYITRFGQHVR